MTMPRQGPLLERLTHRLAETPPDFLDEPAIGGQGAAVVAAVVHDLLRLHGHAASREALKRFEARDATTDRNRLALALIACWLLADDWFVSASIDGGALLQFLGEESAILAAMTPAPRFVHDPDRREELARTCLARLDFVPEGETGAQANDRLSSISGAERQRLLAASREMEARAHAVREALVKKAAEESADKWSRE
ncbi:MAG TPA: hypothetical protein VGO76_15780 [Luteibacter sp.]|jgi:hypothetical protein|nr:hypothetical protein [Luteibacter sp.]